jgi:hypothetical protein
MRTTRNVDVHVKAVATAVQYLEDPAHNVVGAHCIISTSGSNHGIRANTHAAIPAGEAAGKAECEAVGQCSVAHEPRACAV